MTNTVPPPPSAPPKAPKPSILKQAWFIGIACGAVGIVGGLVTGIAVGSSDPKESDEYTSMVDRKNAALNDAADALEVSEEAMETMADSIVSLEGDLPAREEAVAAAVADVEQREADVKIDEGGIAAAEKAVAERERDVGIVETEIEANTIPGEGVYEVGPEMKPGTYKTAGSPGCYFAVLNGLEGFDIANNGNPNGPAFAVVNKGQYFETTRCEDWILQP